MMKAPKDQKTLEKMRASAALARATLASKYTAEQRFRFRGLGGYASYRHGNGHSKGKRERNMDPAKGQRGTFVRKHREIRVVRVQPRVAKISFDEAVSQLNA